MTCHRPYYNRGGTLTEKDFLKIGKEGKRLRDSI